MNNYSASQDRLETANTIRELKEEIERLKAQLKKEQEDRYLIYKELKELRS